MITGDTIAAIATAPGRGGVAVVRVSGPEAFQVAERLTGKARSPETRESKETRGENASREVKVVKVYASVSLASPVPPVIDECVVLAFRAPHSYTGEDVVEFQCHGGSVTPRRVLAACLASGARLARRGEFTQRAFLAGKLDYDQAESVLDLVDAKTERAADAALEGLAGRKQRELKALYEVALDLSAKIEHALDVDEGELPEDFASTLKSEISDLQSRISTAVRRAREGRLLRTGALVVLAGPPNAGKSSLMNALLETNRAIVSDVPGTTRDSIEEWLDLDGWPIRLVDTAGLRKTVDAIEAEGVRRSEDLMAKADVILLLGNDGGEGLFPVCRSSAVGCPSPVFGLSSCVLSLHSKCDLGRGQGLNVSAKTGEGLEELKREIVKRLESRVGDKDEGESVSADEAALREALAMLETGPSRGDKAESSGGRETGVAERENDLVLLANAVRAVAERLGTSVGATYSSDLLDNLFSRFCVGK